MEGPLCCSPYHPYCPQGGRNWTLDTLQPRTAGHPRRIREGPKRTEADTASLQSLKFETRLAAGLRRINLTLLIIATFLDHRTVSTNPHQPMNLTWMILSATTREAINSTSAIHPQNTWWLDLEFDLCLLATGSWDIGEWEVKMPSKPVCGAGINRCNTRPPTNSGPGCSYFIQQASLWKTPFYVCPGRRRDRVTVNNCGGANEFYCANWGCKSTGTVLWEPPIRGDLITWVMFWGPLG